MAGSTEDPRPHEALDVHAVLGRTFSSVSATDHRGSDQVRQAPLEKVDYSAVGSLNDCH